MKLYDYQIKLVKQGIKILQERKVVYLAFRFRVGKTAVALSIANEMQFKRVLLLTTKINIKGHLRDFASLGYSYHLDVEHYNHINIKKIYERSKKEPYDCIICDEAHKLGAFPKPSKTTKMIKDLVYHNSSYVILMSATPSPESYSQLYHQFWITRYSPFKETTFYKWASAGYVNIKQIKLSGRFINDYKDARIDLISPIVAPYLLFYTQKQAGFKVTLLEDELIIVPTTEGIKKLHSLIKILTKERVYIFRNGVDSIVCDTVGSLQRKVHQICSGTVIGERNGQRTSYILDDSKLRFIQKHYKGKKIAIFYLFQAEGDLLKQSFKWTNDPATFNASDSDTVFIGQFNASCRGINLEAAQYIIFYNIPFSSEMYQQARQRGQGLNKTETTKLHWLCIEGGIEKKIYQRVINKQSYTLFYFKQDYINRGF